MDVVGAQGNKSRRIGPEVGSEQRIECCVKSHRGKRIGLHTQRVGPRHQTAPHNSTRPAMELRMGRQADRTERTEKQQESDTHSGEAVYERSEKRRMNRSMSASSAKPMVILPPPCLERLIEISCEKNFSSCSTNCE